MENISIFETASIDSTGQQHLSGTGKWSKFIGIVYIVSSCLMLLCSALIIFSFDRVADVLMQMNGLSQQALDFFMGGGKWLFLIIMVVICLIPFLNGIYLLRFGSSTKKFELSQSDVELASSFLHLGNYLTLTTILSVISVLFSIVAIILNLMAS